MSLAVGLLLVLLVAAAAFVLARGRATALRSGGAGRQRLNSLPTYHGTYAFLWAAIPALLFLAAWTPIQQGLIGEAVLASPAGQQLPDFDLARDSILEEAQSVASGASELAFNPAAQALVPVFQEATTRYSLIGGGFALLLALAGAGWAWSRIGVNLRARAGVEKWLMGLLVAASMIAILTTFGIVLSLLFETMRFFSMVPAHDFLFGTSWSPQVAIRADQAGSSGAFGSVPLFWGTIFIGAIIAMIVAIPLGLMSAIFLTQYAPAKLRSVLKPLLEILAGVPTVVYGYFAALTVAPLIRDLGISIGISNASSESALAAGLVMGVGLAANLTANPFDSVTTVTTQIVQLLTGDQEFDSPKTLAAFALGLVLFLVTLVLNLIALRVVRKYREAYE
jgi:phosphate transport system permease protein